MLPGNAIFLWGLQNQKPPRVHARPVPSGSRRAYFGRHPAMQSAEWVRIRRLYSDLLSPAVFYLHLSLLLPHHRDNLLWQWSCSRHVTADMVRKTCLVRILAACPQSGLSPVLRRNLGVGGLSW